MNCLRISPGTSRKPGAIVRKCAAQAARLICGGSLYWTIAVIMVRLPSAAACCRMVGSLLHLAGLKAPMALASCPACHRQQRSLRRMRQVLSWAFARSPGPRSDDDVGVAGEDLPGVDRLR